MYFGVSNLVYVLLNDFFWKKEKKILGNKIFIFKHDET